jgi:hypothetical protein
MIALSSLDLSPGTSAPGPSFCLAADTHNPMNQSEHDNRGATSSARLETREAWSV